MIPELCPTDWYHRDKRSLTFPPLFMGGRTAEEKAKRSKKREIKACRPNDIGGLGMEISPNSEDLSVVLYGAAVDGIPPSETGRKSAGC